MSNISCRLKSFVYIKTGAIALWLATDECRALGPDKIR